MLTTSLDAPENRTDDIRGANGDGEFYTLNYSCVQIKWLNHRYIVVEIRSRGEMPKSHALEWQKRLRKRFGIHRCCWSNRGPHRRIWFWSR